MPLQGFIPKLYWFLNVYAEDIILLQQVERAATTCLAEGAGERGRCGGDSFCVASEWPPAPFYTGSIYNSAHSGSSLSCEGEWRRLHVAG